jgi:hypothetical protein
MTPVGLAAWSNQPDSSTCQRMNGRTATRGNVQSFMQTDGLPSVLQSCHYDKLDIGK